MSIKQIDLVESAVTFEGFGEIKRHDSQPEIIDPKTGKPYDLNDPQLPVVKGHRFRWNYWSMPKMPTVLLNYLNEHYDYFNRTRFSSRLTKPNIALLKDVDALRMRLRGLWTPRTRTLSISPNLFNAPHEGWVNRVLIHEMCHQEVTDHYGGEREEGGHGPKWKASMLRAGLTPNRYDMESNETYMDKKEKKAYQQALDKRKPFLDALQNLRQERQPVTRVAKGLKVVFPDSTGTLLEGEVVGKSTLGPKYYAVKLSSGEIWSVTKNSMFLPQ